MKTSFIVLWSLALSLLLLNNFFSPIMAQTPMKTYTSEWKKIDTLVAKQGLTKSALETVNGIYNAALKEGNETQVLKALVYQVMLEESITEDGQINGIRKLEKTLTAVREPARSVLNNIIAEKYWRYFQENRWKFYNRTATGGIKKDDPETWAPEDFHAVISKYYLASLKNERQLQSTPLTPFEAILIKGNMRNLRPTLYDLLAHRSLNYFRNDERTITKPAYSFEIDNDTAFAPAETFIRAGFKTADTLSPYYHAIILYQKLLSFHLNDKTKDALLDLDIDRLQFVKDHAVMGNKAALYEKALQQITDKYVDLPAASQAWYLQAAIHADYARTYQPLINETYRFEWIKAKEICERLAAQKDSSEGKTNALNLLQQIKEKSMLLQLEQVNLPAQPFRARVSFKNFSKLYFRIVKIDAGFNTSMNDAGDASNDADNYWKRVLALPAIKTFEQAFPDTKDYQMHSAEMKIDALPVGKYALIAGTNADFSINKELLAVHYMDISSLAWIRKSNDYFVLNRETGQPVNAANVQIWYSSYDYNTRKNNKIKGEILATDQHGHFSLLSTKPNTQQNIQLEISTPNDRLSTDDPVYYMRQPRTVPEDRDKKSTFLFLDRSLYRPGQTLYFKGIVVNRNKKMKTAAVAAGFKTTIILFDANQQKVDSIEVTTNEFGSYSGRFTLPVSILNGGFRVFDKSTQGSVYLSVEEYKRPRFEATMEAPHGTYKLNDSIKVKGIATAYAGNALNGAEVKYRVVRRAVFPMWGYSDFGLTRNSGINAGLNSKLNTSMNSGMISGSNKMIWPPYPQNEVEVANGRTVTDATGNFEVTFTAVPDAAIDPKNQPVFYYAVSADITDISGETRSTSASVAVGYHSLKLDMDLPEKLHADSLHKLRLHSTNLNNVFEQAIVSINLVKLKMPSRSFRPRLWEQADQQVIDEQTYISLFPHDIYKNEDDPSAWEDAGSAFSFTDSTHENGQFKLPAQKIEGGWYRFEARAKDRSGDTVKIVRYIQLFREYNVSPGLFVTLTPDKSTVHKGDKLQYSLETNMDSLFIIRDIESGEDSLSRKYLGVNNNVDTETRPGSNGKANARNKESVNNKLSPKNEKGSDNSAGSDKQNSMYIQNKEVYDLPVTKNESGGFGIQVAFVKHNRIFTSYLRIDVPHTDKELTINYETFRDKTLPGSTEKWKLKISGNRGDKIAAEVLTAMYDASLDQFSPHAFNKPDIWPSYFQRAFWEAPTFRQEFSIVKPVEREYSYVNKIYDRLFFDDPEIEGLIIQSDKIYGSRAGSIRIRGAAPRTEGIAPAAMAMQEKRGLEMNQAADSDKNADGIINPTSDTIAQSSQPLIRKNFNETAFFFPELNTDSSGNIEFSFTIPEVLTRWKWMTIAHTKDLAFGLSEKTIVTQKELMVQPNATRFVRQGDRIDFSGKIVNLTDSEMTGQVELLLIDPTTNRSVDGWFKNVFPNQFFTAPAKQSVAVNFSIEIPFQYSKALTYRMVARSGNISDGEEGILPVLTNRILITEALQLPVRGSAIKDFKFENLLKSEGSETITNHSLSVEYTSNPAWFAIQSLPYLSNPTRESADETFNNYYSTVIAATIAKTSPAIREFFSKYKESDSTTLLSNLGKNPELKSLLLVETPWVLQAKTEREQKRQLALMFDLAQNTAKQQAALTKLTALQLPDGAFAWFPGGPQDRYITQYILTGIGRIFKLNPGAVDNTDLQTIVQKGLSYLDQVIVADYERLVKNTKKGTSPTGGLDQSQIQYGYLRSYFRNYPIPGNALKAYSYYRSQSQQHWLKQSRYMQAMIAIALQRTDDIKTASAIIASLKQNAIVNEELGMYWKDVKSGYYWHQAPVETQSILIEAFAEIARDEKSVTDMKTWLLKQKQTQGWSTTRATADACYALLLTTDGEPLNGINELLTNIPVVEVRLGTTIVSSSTETGEAGSGYFKKIFTDEQVKPSMGNIQVTVAPVTTGYTTPGTTTPGYTTPGTTTPGNTTPGYTTLGNTTPGTTISKKPQTNITQPGIKQSGNKQPGNKQADIKQFPTWGAVYWQYFENLDQVAGANGSLHIKKNLFVENNTANGPVLTPYNSLTPLKVGDKVKVRLELKTDRDFDYVHLKDMRAAGMEPVNVLSSYKWQDGLGYYESTSDAATNFYFSRINRGTYVFEYVVFVTHTGNFSNGIATLQSLYAPEFRAHSAGINVSVE